MSEPGGGEFDELAGQAVDLVRQWLAERPSESTQGARRLAELLRSDGGLDWAVQFIDGVARPSDLAVAGAALNRLAGTIPASLPAALRAAIWVGGRLGPVVPWAVVPAARRVLRQLVGHLVLDSETGKLGSALARLRQRHPQTGVAPRLGLNLLGEAVLGDGEADRRLDGVRALLERPDVDYVSIKVSSIVSGLTMWAFDDAVNRVVERLSPLYELAASSTPAKFINLDMEEYRDLALTIAVFKRLLARPGLNALEAGIVLQAYLPDALDALQDLTEWAHARRAEGGAGIKVRIVKGANLAMERVDAVKHGWPLATFGSKAETDVNYKRLLDWALTPDHTRSVRIGAAGHNLFDIAFAWLLARRRGVEDRLDVEMLLGMAAEQDAVLATTGSLVLYTPVVKPEEFDVAIAYLVRRLEENGSNENFMSAMFDLASDGGLFEREKARFLAAVRRYSGERHPAGWAPLPNRIQDRTREWQDASATALFHPRVDPVDPAAEAADDLGLTRAVLRLEGHPSWNLFGDETTDLTAITDLSGLVPDGRLVGGTRAQFANDADTDPALGANRAWARRITGRIATSDLGMAAIVAARVSDAELLDRLIASARSAGLRWGAHSGAERAAVIDRAGLAISASRDELIEVMASETGKTIAEGDPEVSEAADFAHYYAALARELDTVQGAIFTPSALTVVTPPWNFPVSIPAGGVLAALAAGSAVIIKPAPQAKRCAAVLVDTLHRAGVPRDALLLVDVDEGELGRQLVADARVDRVILTGSYETAALFRSWRPELELLAETSGKNAVVITPSADVDLAVADLVASAFGHAGQKCSAASLAILVGSVGTDERFLRQLVDAVSSLRVGYPSDPAAQMGPLIQVPDGKLLAALTELEPGEYWLVEPRRLDDTGRLWSPGVRAGVRPGSTAHLTEFFGPVLGVMTARTLEEALELQNAVDYGLTAGLHSLDAAEIGLWLERVEAGNLYVNRGITGAIVQRQPFGGWKRSSVGTGAKAGGPNALIPLGTWHPDPGGQSSSLHLRGVDPLVTELIEAGQSAMSYDEFDLVRRSVLSDAIAYATEYGEATDASRLGVERNVLRYRPTPVSVRASEGTAPSQLLRVLAAATRARSRVDLSTAEALPPPVQAVLDARAVRVVVESDEEWLSRLTFSSMGSGSAAEAVPAVPSDDEEAAALLPPPPPASRIRLLSGPEAAADGLAAARALRGSPDVAIYDGEVTASGRVELLPFFREQAISITNHRFGNPSHLADGLF